MTSRHVVAACLVLIALSARGDSGLVLDEVQRVALPQELSGAADIRIEDDDTIIVAARKFGAARVAFAAGEIGTPQLLMAEGTSGGVVMAEHLGWSGKFLVVSSPLSQLLWQRRESRGDGEALVSGGLGDWVTPDRAPISFFEDIDLRAGHLAVLGLMRSETGMSPDGAIAWTFDLDESPVTPHPLAYARAGKGARPFHACLNFSIGKVRYLADGSLLMVPGAEPGIFLYSPDGKLVRTWDTAALGLDLRCDFDDETLLLYASDFRARLAQINRFTTVDEVLPTTPEPALLLRSVKEDGTHWVMALLAEDGTIRTIDVPITSPSQHARLRGDVSGDRILLLLQRPLWDKNKGETSSADLIELRMKKTEKKPTPSSSE